MVNPARRMDYRAVPASPLPFPLFFRAAGMDAQNSVGRRPVLAETPAEVEGIGKSRFPAISLMRRPGSRSISSARARRAAGQVFHIGAPGVTRTGGSAWTGQPLAAHPLHVSFSPSRLRCRRSAPRCPPARSDPARGALSTPESSTLPARAVPGPRRIGKHPSPPASAWRPPRPAPARPAEYSSPQRHALEHSASSALYWLEP
jgi:hypothetical protein